MRILFISDFNISQFNGGAQISNDIIIKKGRELGHEIIEFNYDSSPINFIYRYDLVISSNLNIISMQMPNVIDYIINSENHARLEHDSCLYLDNQTRKKLFQSCKKTFFLSNFHLDFFKETYGDYFINNEIVYDPINTDIFNNKNLEKIYDIVYCGFLSELKGCKNLIKFCKENPNRKIDIFGWAEDEELLKELQSLNNVKIHNKVGHIEVADILKKSKYIYHSPVLNEPFCRMVAEALLCGCKFIGNENKIGSIQEYLKEGEIKFKQNCQNASEIFWSKII